MTTERTALFVCPHGAGKSRIAAAWFQVAAPHGWQAITAGVHPQERVSEHAVRLLAGTAAAASLDDEPPRPISAVRQPDVVIAIDCPAGEVEAAEEWRLDNGRFDSAMNRELRERAERLAAQLRPLP